jgi:hypothetical protein
MRRREVMRSLGGSRRNQRRAGRQDRAADQFGWERCEVRALEAPSGYTPDSAGVLAQRMTGEAFRASTAQAVLATC